MHRADKRLLWRVILVGSLIAAPAAFVAAELTMPLPKSVVSSAPGVPASPTPVPVPPPPAVPLPELVVLPQVTVTAAPKPPVTVVQTAPPVVIVEQAPDSKQPAQLVAPTSRLPPSNSQPPPPSSQPSTPSSQPMPLTHSPLYPGDP